jgi:uncharacterized protein (UPF0297 family)
MLFVVSAAWYQGTSNVRILKDVFFSIKNKKFIRPMTRKGNRVDGYHEYKLHEGTYVTFNFDYWSKREPSIIFSIKLIKMIAGEKSYHLDELKNVEIKCNKRSEILEVLKENGFEVLQEIVSDFLSYVPGYHTGTDIKELAQKVYDEEVVKKLLEFLEKHNNEELFYHAETE